MSATWWIEHRGEQVSRRWTDDPSTLRHSAKALAAAGMTGEVVLIETTTGRTIASRQLAAEAPARVAESPISGLAAD